MKRSRIEVRWHGRGGHGAVTGAMILAEAAFIEGYRGVTAAPFFGAERRGAPVIATNRFGPRPIRTFSLVTEPDVVIVLDETLMDIVDVSAGLKPDGIIIINTVRPPEDFTLSERFNVATCDAFHCAIEAGLVVSGTVLFNTTILGGFSRATGLISMKSIEKALGNNFSGEALEKNIEGARRAYENTRYLKPCTLECA
ncbi:2-oxoacid:acceptor oxidoreductase family protein [Thermodesulforhabdus norvegica]|uniref:Pyruvate ferredoxin oxidoreductase, gamma subunit n=1 Tax=Thermodesulforhabdus norvegica TaxID=39841 RepID=A0A1I4TX54_9BACT|nr:2-oxoacid:acceptor oxidoreductase family protein [Thermodesulforhabdus norvegica]SFM81322.1 pyruvate ferredoxin oxidoreductase, gamma subunit [Thermodesulforhabdus norvegica]